MQSASVVCSNGCGLDIGVRDGRIVGVRGRAVDRVNRGRLGPKGLHGWGANNSADRLTQPLVRRNDRLESASWDDAIALLAACETHMSLVVTDQAAQALRDRALQHTIERIDHHNQRQWLLTRIKHAAPQAIVVPS